MNRSNVATVIIDGNHLFVRAFKINEQKVKANEPGASDLGAVYITLTSIRKRLQQFKFKNAYITWDKPVFKGKHYRYQLTGGNYKANRPPKPDKFYELLDQCIEMSKALGVKTILPYQLEADDVIAYLSVKSEKPCVICTGDNDLLQLLVTPGVSIYNIIKEETITADNILGYFPVRANEVCKYKALFGDTGDNIDGLDGYGEKKIAKIFENYDINIQKLKPEEQSKYKLNLKLVSLGYALTCPEHRDTEIPFIQKQLEDQANHKADYNKFFDLAGQYGFDAITRNKGAWKDIVDRERVNNILTEMFKDLGK